MVKIWINILQGIKIFDLKNIHLVMKSFYIYILSEIT